MKLQFVNAVLPGGLVVVSVYLTTAVSHSEQNIAPKVVRGRKKAAGKMTSLLATTLDSSSGVAAGLMDSGGLGVALPCASPKRSRPLLEVFDDCLHVGRRLSSWCDHQIVERVRFAANFLETGGVGHSESCEKVEYSILSTDIVITVCVLSISDL